jgi:putative oxidoreductase
MVALRNILAILGRILLCSIFILAIAGVVRNREKTENWVINHSAAPIPVAETVLVCAAVAGLGSLLIIVGYKARFGAFLLLVLTGVLIYAFDPFWTQNVVYYEGLTTEVGVRFVRDVMIAGAFLFILANGAGHCSLDKLLEKPKPGERAKGAGSTAPAATAAASPQAGAAPRPGDPRGQRPLR